MIILLKLIIFIVSKALTLVQVQKINPEQIKSKLPHYNPSMNNVKNTKLFQVNKD